MKNVFKNKAVKISSIALGILLVLISINSYLFRNNYEFQFKKVFYVSEIKKCITHLTGNSLVGYFTENGYKKVPFDPEDTFRPVIEIKINGVTEEVCMVDTAAQKYLEVPKEFQEKFKVSLDNAKTTLVVGVGKDTIRNMMSEKTNEIEFGDVILKNQAVEVIGNDDDMSLMGIGMIYQCSMIFDYFEKAVYISKEKIDKTKLKDFLERNGYMALPLKQMPLMGFLYTSVSINGIATNLLIDTGAEMSFIESLKIEKLQLQKLKVESDNAKGVGGEVSVKSSMNNTLKKGDFIDDDFSCVLADFSNVSDAVKNM